MTIFNTFRPQRKIVYLSMAQERLVGLDHPIGDPWGGAAYGEYLKGGWVGQQLGSIGDAVSGAVQSIGDVVSDIGSAIDKNVLQPVYREVIQPVGHAFEKIGQQIAADPITFIAQVAAIAAAPFTGGASLWALPVITAASTAAHGGSIEQILTATAISAATAWAGGAGGVGTGVSGLVSGIADTGMQCVPTFMGQVVNYGTQQVLTQVATGVTMAGINAIGAAAQGRDALQAALPALIGTAAGAGMQTLANTPQFQELGAALNKVGDNLGSVAQTTLTGLTAAVIKTAVTGKDMTVDAVNTLAGGLISGLTSSVDSISSMFKDNAGNFTQGGAAAQGVLSNIAANVMATSFLGGKAGDALSATTTQAIAKTLGSYVTTGFNTLVDGVQSAYNTAVGAGDAYRSSSKSLEDVMAERSLYTEKANKDIQRVYDAKQTFDLEYASYEGVLNAINNGGTAVDTNRVLGGEGGVAYGPEGTIVAYGANGQWSYKTIGPSGSIALNNDTFGDPINGTYKYGYVVTRGGYTMDDLNASAAAVQRSITNYNNINTEVGNNYQNIYVPHIDELDAKIGTIQKTIETSATDYARALAVANDKAQLLADKENEISQAATKAVVMAIDPKFDEAAYKQLNGLGGDINAYGHYLAQGKYQGLPTNMEAGQGSVNGKYSELFTDIAKRMGYSDIVQVPAEVRADTIDKLVGMFGNNLAALNTASVDSILKANPELKITDLMPKVTADQINESVKEYVANNPTVGSYRPSTSDFSMPTGYQYASQIDVAKAMAGQSTDVGKMIDKSGNVVYVKQIPTTTPVLIYDKDTGNMTQTASVLTDMVNSKTLNAADKLKIFSAGDPETLKYIADSFPAVGTNTATVTDNLVSTIRDGAKIILESAKGEDAPLIYKIAAYGLDAGAATLDGIAQVTSGATFIESMIRNVNPNDQASMEISKGLNSVANAMRSDDMKAAMQSLNDALKTKGTDVIGAVLNNAADNPAGMVNFIGTNLVAMLPGFGLGKWVGAGTGATAASTELASFSQAAVQKLIGNASVNATRAYEIAMEASSNGLQAFNEARDLLKKQNPSWTDAQLDDAAMSRAKLVAGTAALTTVGTQVVGLDKVTQNLMGANNPSSSAFQSVLNKLVASPLSESIGEGFQSGIPQLMSEYLYKEIDPSRTFETAIGNIAGQTTLGSLAGAGSAVAVGAVQTAQDIPALAVETNAAFNQAINAKSYTMGELGAVINQWIPQSTAMTTNVISEVRNTVIPQILLSNPQLALGYENPQAYMDAVKNTFGVWEVPVLADIAEAVPKFAAQVTTEAEAQKILTDKGLTGVTVQDAAAAGLIGATTADQATRADTYVNQQMVSEAEVRAAAAQENYNVTADELKALVGRGVQADVIAKFVAEVDPKAVTTAEATQYFKDLGYTKATATDIAQFVKSAPEESMKTAVAEWVNPRQVTRAEALQFFSELGYVPNEAEITKYIVQGPEVFQDAIKQQLGEYVDPRYVDAAEVRQAFKNLGLEAPVSASDIARLSGQYAESELAGKAKEGLPVVSANAVYSLLAGNSIASQQVKDQILARIEDYKNLGMDQAAAQSAATQAVAAQLGTTKSDLLSALGATEQNLLTQISGVKNELLTKIEQYRSEGMTQAEANAKAVTEVSAKLGVTKTELLSQLGATESNLQTQISGVSAKVDTTAKAIMDQMAANQAAGQSADTALNNAINKVASDLGSTKDNLLAKMGLNQAELQKQIASVQAGTQAQINTVQQQILDKVAQYQAQGISSDKALQAAIDTVASSLGTTKTDLLSQIGQTESTLKTFVTQQVSATESKLADIIAKNETSGMARDQATQAAIDELSGQLGTTRTDLLSKIDLTSQQFQNQISIAKTDLSKQITLYQQQTGQQLADTKAQIQSQMQAYEQAGIDRDTALGLAISGVAQSLGTTKADLLTQMGASETALRNEFTTQTQALSTQVQDVAQLLGKPVSQVTANDITMVQNMIGGQTATNLAYDVNQDQKVDAADLALLQQQQQIQQGTNVTQTIDPTTGLPVYTDKTTGQVITGFTPVDTSPWAATGVYAALEQQKAQEAATAKAQAATAAKTAATAQKQSNFNTMLGMVLSAPDASGQKVTVQQAPLTEIKNVYDFSSIFANPTQAGLFVSPYGAVNNVGPSQQGGLAGLAGRQAANQPMMKQASGFASGGMIGGDIEVGDGGSIDDLLNLVKGNSG